MARWEYKEPAKRFFDGVRRKQVEVLLEAILPQSETSPGATDANAVEYVDRLLSMDASTYYDIPRWRQQYAQALPILASVAATRFGGKALEALTTDEATKLLADLAAGKLFGEGQPQAWQTDLFNTIRAHAIEGCFTDQRWGGNRQNIMWEWYGYPTGPSRPFQRSAGGDCKQPANPGPELPAELKPSPPLAWLPAISGNTSTSVKKPEDPESATLTPELATQAIKLSGDNKPGTPWPGQG